MALTKTEIKRRLRRGGQQRIAEELNVSPSTVSNVVNRRTQLYAKETVQMVRTAIAGKIGESVEEVFGSAA